jgi:hypothetical protein
MSSEKDISTLKNEWIFWKDFQKNHADIFRNQLTLKWYLRQNSEKLSELGAIAYENSRRLMIHHRKFFEARNAILEKKPVFFIRPRGQA